MYGQHHAREEKENKTMAYYYKVLDNSYIDGNVTAIESCHDRSRWIIGEKRTIDNNDSIEPCSNGFHASRTISGCFATVSGDIIALVRPGDTIAPSNEKIATESMTILRAWNFENIRVGYEYGKHGSIVFDDSKVEDFLKRHETLRELFTHYVPGRRGQYVVSAFDEILLQAIWFAAGNDTTDDFSCRRMQREHEDWLVEYGYDATMLDFLETFGEELEPIAVPEPTIELSISEMQSLKKDVEPLLAYRSNLEGHLDSLSYYVHQVRECMDNLREAMAEMDDVDIDDMPTLSKIFDEVNSFNERKASHIVKNREEKGQE